MRRFVLVLTVLGVLMTFTGTALAAPVYTEDGERAYASWEEEGEDTFVFTEVTLYDRTFTEEGETFDEAFLGFTRFEFDEFGYVQLIGETELVADQYYLDASGGTFSASVETELEVFGLDCMFLDGPFADCSPIGPFEVTVAVTWDDVSGRLYPEVFTSTSHFPGEVGVTTERGMARYTSASGEITGDLPATLDASFVASIARVDEGVRFVAL